MEYKKINNIKEIYQDGKLLIDSFSGLDLSNIDLSELPLELSTNLDINNAKLNGTNFHIVIDTYPKWIHNVDISGTRLEFQQFNNDHSINFNNTFFDSEQIEYLNKINLEYPNFIYYDLKTCLNNSNLKVSTDNFIRELRPYLYNSLIVGGEFMNKNELVDKVKYIEGLIENNASFAIKTIYHNIKDQMTNYEKIEMFHYPLIKDKKFHDFTITEEIYEGLMKFNIVNCTFENVDFNISTDKLFLLSGIHNLAFNIDDAKNVTMPNIKFSDWGNVSEKRILNTIFTFRKSLYLELGRECNANCSFCRNNCMDQQPYNLSKIKSNLLKIGSQLDYIVIGGGEPTLRKNDLSSLFELYAEEAYQFKSQLYLFTNGTYDLLDLLDNYYTCDLGYNVSRHSANDDINASVFGLDKERFLTWEQLSELKKLTLACTCINGATDSADKIIEYIKKAEYYNIKNVMFSNLHNNASIKISENNIKNSSISIDSSVFDDAIKLIKSQGYISSYPIVSSGGYELTILKHKYYSDRTDVSFKRYLSKEELDLLWPKAIKRTFDLSMAPDGTIYENWSETGQKVKILK